jgi:hypothetical protein
VLRHDIRDVRQNGAEARVPVEYNNGLPSCPSSSSMTGAGLSFQETTFLPSEFTLRYKDVFPVDPDKNIRLAAKIERLARISTAAQIS